MSQDVAQVLADIDAVDPYQFIAQLMLEAVFRFGKITLTDIAARLTVASTP